MVNEKGVPPHVARGLTEEERDLEFLLAENYEFLTEESGENCARQALNYICSIDTIAKDIDFVKKLTKVADHVSSAFFDRERQKVHPQVYERLQLDHYRTFFSDRRKDTCGFLEKLYTFNLKGAETADSPRGKDELRSEEHFTRIKSHFLAYAGNAARRLSSIIGYKEKGIMWAKEAYNCYTRSAKIAEKPEPRHAAYAYTRAAEAAEKIYKTAGDIQWLVKTYNSFKDSACLAVTAGEIRHAIYAYNKAAMAAYEIYLKNPDEKAKNLAKEQQERCLKLSLKLLDKIFI